MDWDYACARGLAREGCHLVICSRDEARINAAAEQIRSETGATVEALVADVSNAAEAERLVGAAVSAFGGLEILVHNAGGPLAGRLLAVNEAQWKQAFDQNMMSFVRIVTAAVPEMKKAGYGRVLIDRVLVDQAADPEPGALERLPGGRLGDCQDAVAGARSAGDSAST